jgi:hypothetical protein
LIFYSGKSLFFKKIYSFSNVRTSFFIEILIYLKDTTILIQSKIGGKILCTSMIEK